MSKQLKYLVKFTNAQNDNGTVWYTIDVYSQKDDLRWTFKERFSHMRELHVNCEKTKHKNDLPVFPPRKLFNSTDEAFIQKRKKELENYYNTLLKSIPLEELPDILHFLNTNKPKVASNKGPGPVQNTNKQSAPVKTEIKDKQQQTKKIFEEIVGKTFKEMVESNEFDTEIEDETRRKFNQQFQKLKLDLKSPLLDKVLLPQGDKQNDTDFWSVFFKQQHEDKVKKLDKAIADIDNILKESNKCKVQFVVPL